MMAPLGSFSREQSFSLEGENFYIHQKQAADTITVVPRLKKRPLEADELDSSLSAKMAERVNRRKQHGGREEHEVAAAASGMLTDRDEPPRRAEEQVQEEEDAPSFLESIIVASRSLVADLSFAPASPQQQHATGTSTGASTPHVLRNGKPRIVIRHNKRKGQDADRIEGLGGKIGLGATPRKGEPNNKENPGKEEVVICVSTLLRRQDFEAMPSLESALRKDVKRRGSEAGLGARKMQNKGLANGFVKGNGNGNGNGNETGTTSSSSSASSVANAMHAPKASKNDKPLERNIDNVIFGDVTFKSWYPSWYPKEIIGEKALHGEGKGIVVPELYICKRCFGYGKVLVEWVRHCRCCEKGIPGERIYSHGVRRGGNEATWSVWEVDGSVDTLFCQNLSLFAKLFLDNKSVFFDVQGFNYFLLVHTSPPSSPTPGAQQIVGFFSKEKMSWDNNNLACILIFPPWQRKGLGALLMGVSYSIARREGILGGPEKPISELGMKGYKRYWGAEIARWLLDVKESDKKKSRGMVDVLKCSNDTWIAPDDCLMVLREMDVVERAGKGKGTVDRVKVDKEKVRRWVDGMGLKLERVVYEEGFVEGYAMKEEEEEEDEEEEVEESGD